MVSLVFHFKSLFHLFLRRNRGSASGRGGRGGGRVNGGGGGRGGGRVSGGSEKERVSRCR